MADERFIGQHNSEWGSAKKIEPGLYLTSALGRVILSKTKTSRVGHFRALSDKTSQGLNLLLQKLSSSK